MTIIGTQLAGALGVALLIAVLLLVGGLLCAVWRLLVGPTLADRVVALDLMSGIMIVFLVLFKLVSGINAYMYAAIALSLIAFLATVAFANYIDRTRGDSEER